MLDMMDCQYCGSEAMLIGEDFGVDELMFYVECIGCHKKSGAYDNHKTAIDEWNKGMMIVAERNEYSNQRSG